MGRQRGTEAMRCFESRERLDVEEYSESYNDSFELHGIVFHDA